MPDRPALAKPLDQHFFTEGVLPDYITRIVRTYHDHPACKFTIKNGENRRYLYRVEGLDLDAPIRALGFLCAVLETSNTGKPMTASCRTETFIGKGNDYKIFDTKNSHSAVYSTEAIQLLNDITYIVKPYKLTQLGSTPKGIFSWDVDLQYMDENAMTLAVYDAHALGTYIKHRFRYIRGYHYTRLVALRHSLYAQHLLGKGMALMRDGTNSRVKKALAFGYAQPSEGSARTTLAAMADAYRILAFVGTDDDAPTAREIKAILTTYGTKSIAHELPQFELCQEKPKKSEKQVAQSYAYDDVLGMLLSAVREGHVVFKERKSPTIVNCEEPIAFAPVLTAQGRTQKTEIENLMSSKQNRYIRDCKAKTITNPRREEDLDDNQSIETRSK